MHQELAVSVPPPTKVPDVPVKVPVPFELSDEQKGIFIEWYTGYSGISMEDIIKFIGLYNINRCVLHAIFNCCGKIDTIPADVCNIFVRCVIINLKLVSMFDFKDSVVDDYAIDSLPRGEQFQYWDFVTPFRDQLRRFTLYSTILNVRQKFTVSGMGVCSICNHE